MSDLPIWRAKGYGVLRCTCERCLPPRANADRSADEASTGAPKEEPQQTRTDELPRALALSAHGISPPAAPSLATDTCELTLQHFDGLHSLIPERESAP
jgi:hypothetical protein